MTAALLLAAAAVTVNCCAAELRIGTATISITPDKPVALDGQFNLRVSRGVDNPVTATAVAIEAREGDRVADQAILLSADLVAFRTAIPPLLRERLRAKLLDFDPFKLVPTATHTHTGPVTEEGGYNIPKEGVMPPREYVEFLTRRSRNQELKSENPSMHSHRPVKSDGNVCLLTLLSDVPALAGERAPEARRNCPI